LKPSKACLWASNEKKGQIPNKIFF